MVEPRHHVPLISARLGSAWALRRASPAGASFGAVTATPFRAALQFSRREVGSIAAGSRRGDLVRPRACAAMRAAGSHHLRRERIVAVAGSLAEADSASKNV